MQIAKRYEVAKEFIAQHEGQGTLWQDECRSLLDRYDSDVFEFQSEQKMAVAEKLQMNIVEHDSARTSARISALEREFSELKSRSAVFWKMSWVQPARDLIFAIHNQTRLAVLIYLRLPLIVKLCAGRKSSSPMR